MIELTREKRELFSFSPRKKNRDLEIATGITHAGVEERMREVTRIGKNCGHFSKVTNARDYRPS